MPATTTAINACGARIQLADTGGTLQDISGSANEATIKFNQEVSEFKVFGSGSLQRLSCGNDVEVSLTLIYTTTTNEGKDLLKVWRNTGGGKRRLTIALPSGSTGSDLYDGIFLYKSIDIPAKADEAKPIMIKVELVSSGDVTWGTV